ncbi:transmembrane protein 33-like [Watersipora subatra]|uniref:transmembrane protein 33-like n=1 Tax=Watersipora subatra TaxID=2589382 RepID=UPI00355C22AB
MSQNTNEPSAAGEGVGEERPNSTAGGGRTAVINHISSDKIEASMWIARLTTIFFTISFVLPFFGVSQYTSGQRVLIGGAITSALRLHQRVPQMRVSRELLGVLLREDSAHYLFYSALMLFTSQPTSMTLMPVFLFAVLHVTKYTKILLDLAGPSSLPLIRRLIAKIDTKQQDVLKLIATVEITLMPTSLLLLLSGFATLVLPFLYYRFLCMRYTSVRNPYCRTVFYEMRVLSEYLARDQRCPSFCSNVIYKVIGFVSRMAPVTSTQG